MNITDYSEDGYPNWVISNGDIFVRFDKVVMESNAGLFLYNRDNYVCLVGQNIFKEVLQKMHDMGIKVVDQRAQQWPSDDRINNIGQNSNNGEHYGI